MSDFWVEKNKLMALHAALDQAHEVVSGCTHKGYRRVRDLLNVQPVRDHPDLLEACEKASMSLEERNKLAALSRALESLFFSMTEAEAGEDKEGS